jgi:hypothetical protein
MKKLLLLLPIAGIIAYFSLTSYTTGYPANYTGSRGGPAGCGSSRTCHGNGTYGINVLFELTDSLTGAVVSEYKPNRAYSLKLILLNTTTATLPKFGFQLSTAKGGVQAGAFVPATLPINTTIDTFGSTSLAIWEQVAKLPTATGAGGMGSTYQTIMRWKAPDTGTGAVTFYGAGCLVNNNGAADTIDDKWNVAQRVYNEEAPVFTNQQTKITVALSAYPNPVATVLNLSGIQEMGFVHVSIINLNGRTLMMRAIDGSRSAVQLDVTSLEPGLYQLVVNGLAVQQSISFIKQ